jgi:hypothetical protein
LKDGASQTLANADKAEQEKTWNEAFKTAMFAGSALLGTLQNEKSEKAKKADADKDKLPPGCLQDLGGNSKRGHFWASGKWQLLPEVVADGAAPAPEQVCASALQHLQQSLHEESSDFAKAEFAQRSALLHSQHLQSEQQHAEDAKWEDIEAHRPAGNRASGSGTDPNEHKALPSAKAAPLATMMPATGLRSNMRSLPYDAAAGLQEGSQFRGFESEHPWEPDEPLSQLELDEADEAAQYAKDRNSDEPEGAEGAQKSWTEADEAQGGICSS